jgi:hypothetical protein
LQVKDEVRNELAKKKPTATPTQSTTTKKPKPSKPRPSPVIQDLDLVPTRIPKPPVPEPPQITLKYKPNSLRLQNPIPVDFNSSSEADSDRFVLIGASVGHDRPMTESKGKAFSGTTS